MQIRGSIRPRGLRRGVRTEAFYREIGYKANHGPDLRDVVGTLTLSATQRQDLEFLALLHKALGGLYGKGGVVILNESGEEIARRTHQAEAEQDAPTD